jgi:hypothetical protein
MDTVIFTGRVDLDELRHERPAEYARLVETGRLDQALARPASARLRRAGVAVGTVAVLLGLTMVTLTVYALWHR